MPASNAFTEAWGSLLARRVYLVKIDLTYPSPLTLRLATSELWLPDRTLWQGRIRSISSIHEAGDYLDCGPNPSGWSFMLENSEVAESTPNNVATLLSSYRWKAADCTLYWWERSLKQVGDLFKRFVGTIDRCRIIAERQAIEVNILQSRKYNKKIPTRRVTKVSDPNASENSLGGYLGIALGDWRSLPLRKPFTDNFAKKQNHEDIGGNVPKLPCVVIDKGVGTNPIIALCTQHAVDAINTNLGLRGAMDASDFKANMAVETVAGVNTAGGAGLSVPDESMRLWYPVPPTDVRVVGTYKNTADNPKSAIDWRDESTFATVDLDAGKGRLQLILPNLSNLGVIDYVEVVMLYYTQSGSGACTIEPVNVTTDARGTSTSIPASTAATNVRGTWPTSYYTKDAWAFGNVSGVGDVDLLVTVPSGQKLYVLGVGLVVKYKPSLSVLQTGREQLTGAARVRRGLALGPILGKLSPWARSFLLSKKADIAEQRSPIFVNLIGPRDDGSGSWTGTASALIERSTDLVRYILSNYGALNKSTDFEMGSGAYGSFADARDALKTMELSEYTASFFTNRRERLLESVRTLARESLCQIELDPQTGKWVAMPWVRQPALTYGTLYRDDFESLEVEEMSDTEIAQAVDIGYAWDPSTGERLLRAVVDESNSEQGFLADTFGDQLLQVAAGNKVLKFSPNNGTTIRTATMDEGTYGKGVDVAENLQAKMRAADASSNWFVGHGVSVKLNHLDQIPFDIGGTVYTATLRPYDYTWEALAREAVYQMNLAQALRVFTVTFSRTTGLYSIETSGGAFTLKASTTTRNALATMGYAMGTDLVASAAPFKLTATAVRFQEFMWIAFAGTTGKLYMSGVTVAGTTCAGLLGWFNDADPSVGQDQADRRRGTRQSQAAQSVSDYGERDPIEIDSETLRVWNVAADFRDRLLDFKVQPKVRVRGVSRKMPDIRRGDTFALDPTSIDPWVPYPRQGASSSHAGRVYRVVELASHQGPDDCSNHVVACEIETAPIAAVGGGVSPGYIFSIMSQNGTGNYYVHKLLRTNGQSLWLPGIQVDASSAIPNIKGSAISPDNLGGCVIAFVQGGTGGSTTNGRVYAQRLDANGNKLWGAGGIELTSSARDANAKGNLEMVADASGNWMVIWVENGGSSTAKIWAQKLSPSGSQLWTADGVVVNNEAIRKLYHRCCSDNQGGFYCAWSHDLSGFKVNRIDGTGAQLWGQGVSGAATDASTPPHVALDPVDGGVFGIASSFTVRAHKLSSAGVHDPAWTAAGILVSPVILTATSKCGIVADGKGGAIVGMIGLDTSPTPDVWRMVMQRVDLNGVLQWGTNAVEMRGTADAAQTGTSYGNLIPDGENGAWLVWEDPNVGTSNDETHANRVNDSGVAQGDVAAIYGAGDTADPTWHCSDGAGGVVVFAKDTRSGTKIYAQRVSKSGFSEWTPGGVIVETRTPFDSQDSTPHAVFGL